MFSLNKQQELIIVCDEKTLKTANYLVQLISLKDDHEENVVGIKDGSVNAVIWLEKNYHDNQATLSSNAHVLFIGDSKIAKSQRTSIVEKHNAHGMIYGWLGKRAVMYIDKPAIKLEEYAAFQEYAKQYKDKVETLVTKLDAEGIIQEAAIGAALLVWLGPIGGGIEAVRFFKKRQEVIQQQLDCLALIMYLEGIGKFLEE
jgi:hypothetical protein